jgi:hypothetical protein
MRVLQLIVSGTLANAGRPERVTNKQTVAACESCQRKKLVLSDRYKNKVYIVPLKYLYQLRGCVRPLRVVARKNICFVLLARPCFRYSCFTIFVQFLSFTKKTGIGITL